MDLGWDIVAACDNQLVPGSMLSVEFLIVDNAAANDGHQLRLVRRNGLHSLLLGKRRVLCELIHPACLTCSLRRLLHSWCCTRDICRRSSEHLNQVVSSIGNP